MKLNNLKYRAYLILIDSETYSNLTNGSSFRSRYSHERNAFLLIDSLITVGAEVFVGVRRQVTKKTVVKQIFSIRPHLEIKELKLETVDCIVGLHPQDLDLKKYFPNSLIVAVNPALGFVEYPEFYKLNGGPFAVGSDLVRSLNRSIDLVVNQNHRQSSIVRVFYRLISNWNFDSRVIELPFGFVDDALSFDRNEIRNRMGLEESDIAIISSGGIWKWTDFLTFVEAFILHVEKNPNSRLKLFIMGFSQSDNHDHDNYIGRVKRTIKKANQFIKDRIIIFENWNEASALVNDYTKSADIGINVTQSSLENWQSHRVRQLEYIKYGVPFIDTKGDILSDEVMPDSLYVVEPGILNSYSQVLDQIENQPDMLEAKKSSLLKLRGRFNGTLLALKFIKAINEYDPIKRSRIANGSLVGFIIYAVKLYWLRELLYCLLLRVKIYLSRYEYFHYLFNSNSIRKVQKKLTGFLR